VFYYTAFLHDPTSRPGFATDRLNYFLVTAFQYQILYTLKSDRKNWKEISLHPPLQKGLETDFTFHFKQWNVWWPKLSYTGVKLTWAYQLVITEKCTTELQVPKIYAVEETASFLRCSIKTCKLTSSVNTGAPLSWNVGTKVVTYFA
jgi:hypothetical protein